jgi:signal peptidase I
MRGWAKPLFDMAAIVLIVLAAKTAIAEPYYVPSGSMEPTLQIGDRIIVNKLSVEFGTIHTGDILVFKAPPLVKSTGPNGCGDDVADLVKRVIATPGETVYSKGNTIYIDGHPLDQPWTHVAVIGIRPIKKQKVAANHYFMMGDNEPNSCDSRYWGQLPRSDVIGKAFVRIWPLSRLGWL